MYGIGKKSQSRRLKGTKQRGAKDISRLRLGAKKEKVYWLFKFVLLVMIIRNKVQGRIHWRTVQGFQKIEPH